MTIRSSFPEISPSLNLDFAKSRVLDERVDFSRASNGSYYDGSMHKAEENLLIDSEMNTGLTGLSSYYGDLTAVSTFDTRISADGLEYGDSTGAVITGYKAGASASTEYTFSCFVVMSDGLTPIFGSSTSNNAGNSFYIVIGNAAVAPTTYSIQDLGSGLFRVSATGTSSTTNLARTGVVKGTSNEARTFIVSGYQLEQRSSVNAYTPTTGTPISNYQPTLVTASAEQPRFEIDPSTKESKGLLIEEARTNLLTHSSDFASAFWGQTRSSITSNTIVAPDGTFTGDKLVEDTTSGLDHRTVLNGNTSTTGQTYTFSVFAKAAERKGMRITFSASRFASNYSAYYDLENGVVTSGAAYSTIEPIGNGWYRCTLTTTATADGLFANGIYPTVNGTTYYDGDGSSGIYIWGAQLEEGSFPTSYIPTTGAAVTRNAENVRITGENFSSWYLPEEGSWYVANSMMGSSEWNRFWEVSSVNGENYSIVNPPTLIRPYVYVSPLSSGIGTPSSETPSITFEPNQEIKGAFAYADNDYAVSFEGSESVNWGGKVTGVYDRHLPKDVNTLCIGQNWHAACQLNGHMKKLTYYPKRVSNEQLESLTK